MNTLSEKDLKLTLALAGKIRGWNPHLQRITMVPRSNIDALHFDGPVLADLEYLFTKNEAPSPK
jgi:hypothetical protein